MTKIKKMSFKTEKGETCYELSDGAGKVLFCTSEMKELIEEYQKLKKKRNKAKGN